MVSSVLRHRFSSKLYGGGSWKKFEIKKLLNDLQSKIRDVCTENSAGEFVGKFSVNFNGLCNIF